MRLSPARRPVLKIDRTTFNHPAPDRPAPARAAGAAAPRAPAPGTPADSSPTGLSATARHLAALQGSGNDIDIDRVNRIRAAIISGELKANPDRIADALIASARELLK